MSYLGLVADLAMIVGPCVGYMDQIRTIRNKRSSGGFSKFISLILLVANILRCFFRYYKEFDNVLLYQSILMIGCQLVLIFVCIKYPSSETGSIFTHPIKSFWNWSDFLSYFIFLVIFTVCTSVISFIFHPILQDLYTEMIGTVALFTEAILAVPQVIRNWQTGSADGLSWILVGTFFLGDSYKTVYFYLKNQPFQFVLCGSFQLFIDFVLAFQMLRDQSKKKQQPRGGLLGY
ncbi:hypothetical protein C9374_002671 [Naegleria lovaniensis]|uniref:PQ-loop repeat-containing protein 1 n=1 Tax=Naegleria lovaniensis TaxID=51637 RepID=A0AA88GNW7_NAELO|nr:uncharacterized protein C9374_002671 [Naegleria lovaniensis]KAG2386225.1 hypothetical protein C9374_002671 [Naegleria lovaniensis]